MGEPEHISIILFSFQCYEDFLKTRGNLQNCSFKLWEEIFFRYSATGGNGMLLIKLQEKIPVTSHQSLQKKLNTVE